MNQNAPFRISAVLAGFAVDVAVTFAGILLLSASIGFALGTRGTPPEEAAAFVQSWIEGSTGTIVATAIGVLATVLGGFVAARMGRPAPMRHAAGLAVVTTLLGAATFAAVSPGPADLAGLALTPVAALAGGALVARGGRTAVALA